MVGLKKLRIPNHHWQVIRSWGKPVYADKVSPATSAMAPPRRAASNKATLRSKTGRFRDSRAGDGNYEDDEDDGGNGGGGESSKSGGGDGKKGKENQQGGNKGNGMSNGKGKGKARV
ncbi:MAG: hypothetical protein M1830_002006 [Pleopsidium flavum]|nr:MAG: hypothetical protein M1830_002006 [Pleopsidium flavum]